MQDKPKGIDMTDANKAFNEAAKEDKGKGYGGPAPAPRNNRLYAANRELVELANERRPGPKVEPLCPNCDDKGCEYCDKA